jgi:hypothetical protein
MTVFFLVSSSSYVIKAPSTMGFVGVVAEDEADACCVAVEELAASTQS